MWENGRHGGSAAQLARPILDYWLLTRHKNPIRPQNHQISGGLMTAGIKPGELPSGSTPPATTTGTSTAAPTSASNTAPASTAANTNRSATPPSAPVESD